MKNIYGEVYGEVRTDWQREIYLPFLGQKSFWKHL